MPTLPNYAREARNVCNYHKHSELSLQWLIYRAFTQKMNEHLLGQQLCLPLGLAKCMGQVSPSKNSLEGEELEK